MTLDDVHLLTNDNDPVVLKHNINILIEAYCLLYTEYCLLKKEIESIQQDHIDLKNKITNC